MTETPHPVTSEDLEILRRLLGPGGLILEREQRINYTHDEYIQEDERYLPDVVARPAGTGEVSALLRFAHERGIPVTPRGGGTGLCGGCVALSGGIVLSLERMNRTIEVDTRNLMVTAEAGVPLHDLYAAVEEAGLAFPPHPGDESATVGGVIATNAGGSRAVKYGVVRNFVRGVEAVLPDGEVIQVGGKILKCSTGYSLLNLLIGSEGTLAVITRATFHLIPPAGSSYTLVASFPNMEDAIGTVPALLQGKILPMAVEFIPREVIPITEAYLDRKWPTDTGSAYLMIILDGSREDEVQFLAEQVGGICTDCGAQDIFVADTPARQRSVLTVRSQIYEALKDHLLELLDVTLPRGSIAEFVNGANRIAEEAGLWAPSYGHAADGNVHTHIMKSTWHDGNWTETEGWREKYPVLRDRVHALGRSLGGMISGEHGIGFAKKQYMADFLGPRQLELMRGIKVAFDPKGILNPGKLL